MASFVLKPTICGVSFVVSNCSRTGTALPPGPDRATSATCARENVPVERTTVRPEMNFPEKLLFEPEIVN